MTTFIKEHDIDFYILLRSKQFTKILELAEEENAKNTDDLAKLGQKASTA